jgi:hypothetical protein
MKKMFLPQQHRRQHQQQEQERQQRSQEAEGRQQQEALLRYHQPDRHFLAP